MKQYLKDPTKTYIRFHCNICIYRKAQMEKKIGWIWIYIASKPFPSGHITPPIRLIPFAPIPLRQLPISSSLIYYLAIPVNRYE